jgi:thioredoxin 1
MNVSIKYFTAPWCGPCRMFGPVIEKVTGELGVSLQKINVDDNRDLAAQYNISGVPTMIFEKEGQMVHRHTGAMSAPQLSTILQQL